ncbi:hypothetical protein HAX54_021632 [Datura stramonium]|uniref:Uncharacterized protein n=1 Tax=Datura stramonium TaxID=4076 RepID=A0ABS8UV60_DATST|nr:hypothetical protein [Datura stramonium]
MTLIFKIRRRPNISMTKVARHGALMPGHGKARSVPTTFIVRLRQADARGRHAMALVDVTNEDDQDLSLVDFMT